MRRTRNPEREAAFAADMRDWNWSELTSDRDVDRMARSLEQVVATLTDRHFPLARVRKRSNESPWITRHIRRLWKRKIRLYKKGGRCDRWWETDRQVQKCIQESREAFVERMLEEGNEGSSFYKATRKLASAASVPQWGVQDLYIGKDPAHICQEVLGYFGAISNMDAPPIANIARCHGGLPEFDLARTTELLRAAKKSDSRVEGDPLSHLVRLHPESFAEPVAAIYNRINESGEWPSRWKTEHLTVIPKNPNPSDLSECRNISCTSIFSKILEGVVLIQLRQELAPDSHQYGGVPKCGVEHLLVDLWENILGALEGGTHAAVLLGVDYEKAFNRMEHSTCLEKLSLLGASQGSLALVRAFLEERRMTISIDGHTPDPVPIRRGSPQGSVLGCLLYCVTTQRLADDLRGGEARLPRLPPDLMGEAVHRLRDTAGDMHDLLPMPFLYVDDTTIFDRVPMTDAVRHCTTGTTTERFEDLMIGRDFDRLSVRAEDIGMRINQKKTQLLVISPPNGCDTGASFTTQAGEVIRSVNRLKLVGFTFGERPDAGAHVETIVEQYKQKKWMLHHLREAGFKGIKLYKLYCCYVRSAIEYCSAVYHSLLNLGQEQQLERLQRHALRACFGFGVEVEEVMESHSIQTLKERRIRRCDKFLRKVANNDRFGPRWLPDREEVSWQLRNRRHVQDINARSLRRFNSLLAFLRRRANDLGVLAGGRGGDRDVP